mmetsp:Transcript_1521/g.3200  ORF Transcript_1521/g.3200 Transcript_1521/m.3200 type:complete len:505 (-) Transcript_1521:81-1595(-)
MPLYDKVVAGAEQPDRAVLAAWGILSSLFAVLACRAAIVHLTVQQCTALLCFSLLVVAYAVWRAIACSAQDDDFQEAEEPSCFRREPQPYSAQASSSSPSEPSGGKPSASGGQAAPPKSHSRPEAPAPPKSPRTAAREAIGTRMNSEQAAKAAEKIVALQRYVSGTRVASLDDFWEFFDMPHPGRDRMWFLASDPVIQTLKSKLNRQRLLMHPDKNSHPDAEKTFKYLEQCHQRLTSAFVRDDPKQRENVHQRTRREEEELRQEETRRRAQEEERARFEEKRAREEEERLRKQEEELKKAEKDQERLEWMLRAKQAHEQALQIKAVARPQRAMPTFGPFSLTCTAGAKDEHDAPGSDLNQCAPRVALPRGPEAGILKVQILGAKDLPTQQWFMATNAYAVATIGPPGLGTSARSPGAASANPVWNFSFQAPVFRNDTSLRVTVWREGFGGIWLNEDAIVGSVDIPLLDLEEWSSCVIGRVLEPREWCGSPSCMVLELKAHFEWH